MPYIKSRRERLDMNPRDAENAGELNYVITTLLIGYLHSKGLSYQNINEVVGVLECAKQELYRRVVGKYEDQKIAQNGDVYPTWAGGYAGTGLPPMEEQRR